MVVLGVDEMRDRKHNIFRVLVASTLLASTAWVVNPSSVEGHCPGLIPPNWRLYAAAYETSAVWQNAVKGDIEYTNPTLCNLPGSALAMSLEAITLCSGTSSCPNWVQVGWMKIEDIDSTPKMFCEWTTNGQFHQYHYAVTAATHTYSWEYSNPWWYCKVDGSVAIGLSSGVSMTQGRYMPVQGETNSVDTQIGRMAPSSLALKNLQKRNGIVWNLMHLTLAPPDSPYGNALPATNKLTNWTNAH